MSVRATRVARVESWMRRYLGHVTDVPDDAISLESTLADFGLDSVDLVVMSGAMEEAFGLELDPALFLRCATFAEAAEVVADVMA